MSFVTQLKNGAWVARLGPVGGKYEQHHLPETVKTKDAANKALGVLEKQFRAGSYGSGGGGRLRYIATFERYVEQHLNKLRPRTRMSYASSFAALEPFLQDRYLDTIDAKLLHQFESARKAAGKSNKTIVNDLLALSSIYTQVQGWGHQIYNPVQPYLRGRSEFHLAINNAGSRYLSPDEEIKMIAMARRLAVKDPAMRKRPPGSMPWWMPQAVEIAIDTGMRAEEFLTLTWDRVDLQRMRILIPQDISKNKRDGYIPILKRAADALRSLEKHATSPYVFWYGRGGRYANMVEIMQSLTAQSGIEGVSFHDLRRTCGCRLLQGERVVDGVVQKVTRMRLEDVSLWLRHSSVDVTRSRYAFLETDHLHEAAGITGGSDAV